ncbi:regulator of G-protein signaling 21-like [Mustelus asterias]
MGQCDRNVDAAAPGWKFVSLFSTYKSGEPVRYRNVALRLDPLEIQSAPTSGQSTGNAGELTMLRNCSCFHRPTPEEAMLWSESIDKLLSQKAGLAAFRNFLRNEFSEENIDFWLACEDYKKIKTPTKLASEAKKIYSQFIKVEAPKEINIDFATREHINKSIGEPSPSSFDVAQKLIYSLMAKDCYPRFLKSSCYLELVNKMDNSQSK